MVFRIATVELDAGARLGICPLPGRWGDGLADLGQVVRWEPEFVVSMTGISEMERHNIADLGGLLGQFGIGWRHFPIRDFDAPEAMSGWAELATELHRTLDGGGGVLAHCYGGQGRSGMVLMRLMVERGEAPEAALARLRAVRPGAVERPGQYDWAAAGTHTRTRH